MQLCVRDFEEYGRCQGGRAIHFLKLWGQREGIEISVSLKSYLCRAVHNTSLNRLKHLKIQDTYRQYVGVYLNDTFGSATDIMDRNELENRISEALEKLP